jgi:hypothetical protein
MATHCTAITPCEGIHMDFSWSAHPLPQPRGFIYFASMNPSGGHHAQALTAPVTGN